MPTLYKTPRRPSQDKIERDLKRFDVAASRLLATISAIEAAGVGIDPNGVYLNALSPRFEAIVTARDLVRQVVR